MLSLERRDAIRSELWLSIPFNSDLLSDQYGVSQEAVGSTSAYFQQSFKANSTGDRDPADAISEVLGKNAVGFNGALAKHITIPSALGHLWHNLETHPALLDVFTALVESTTNEMRFDRVITEDGLVGVSRTYHNVVWG